MSKGAQGLKEKICSICRTCVWTYPYSRTFCRLWKKRIQQSADVDLSIFAAKSLNGVMDEICAAYTKAHPNVNFQNNYDSSGTLMAPIKDGEKLNIFCSAGVAQMDELQNGYDGGSVVDGTGVDLLNNQVCLVTYKNRVARQLPDLQTSSKAKNMALADGTVPVGQYARAALVKPKNG